MTTVRSGSATIYYEVHGQGPALVFAHGRGGNAAIWWQQVPHFARRYKTIVFDHRTFGRSQGGGGADFTQRQFVADLVAILAAEGIDRAALVTQSMGGRTGLGAAVYHPQRVGCLVLTSTIGGLTSPELEALIGKTNPGPPGPGRALAKDFPAREPGLALLYAQLQAFNTGMDPRDADRLKDPPNRITVDQLAGYDIPTLLISADQDPIAPPEVMREAARLLPGAELVEFPGAGHSPYWENAARYNEIVDEFLARHWPAGATATK